MRYIPIKDTTTTAAAATVSNFIKVPLFQRRQRRQQLNCTSVLLVFGIHLLRLCGGSYCFSITIFDRQPNQYCTTQTLHLQSKRYRFIMKESHRIDTRKRSLHHENDVNDNVNTETSVMEYTATNPKRMKLLPTLRDFSVHIIPSLDHTISFVQRKEMAIHNIQAYTRAMQERYQQMIPFTNENEINIILKSLQNVIPVSSSSSSSTTTTKQNSGTDTDPSTVQDDNIDHHQSMNEMLQHLQNHILPQYAHLSHKNWTITGINANQWHTYLFPRTTTTTTTTTTSSKEEKSFLQQRHMLERIYREGNWDGAIQHHQQQQQLEPPPNIMNDTMNDNIDETTSVKPWAVLVTGVNGIRKTTSIYQDWFPSLLQEAILSPPSEPNANMNIMNLSSLPCGSNSFFRQLDHMIATLCNEEFIRLYTYTRDMLVVDINDNGTAQVEQPSSDIIQLYSNMKAAIFSRYRTISELLGVILLREAQSIPINCMVETSGRDVAMFHYIDHFFPAETYNKLALHFTINDLQYAKASVDQRMIDEIQSGIAALNKNSIFDIINANVGGPYGSEVLSDIQADSDRVWTESVLVDDGGVGHDWYKATIQINAHATEPWTAQAVKRDGSLGTMFHFQRG